MEQTKDVVYTERLDEGIEVIVFNQPGKKNAISARMMDLLEETLSRAAADDEVRVIVIRGAGDVFSSGGDLSQSGDRAKTGPEYSRKTLLHYEQALRAVRRCPKPIIAMVDGYAVGGAFALVLACDLVCASERSRFIPAFCQIGIIPEMGMMKYLPELIGSQRAKEMLFLGGKIPGEKLFELGLINRLVPAESLEEETLSLARAVSRMPGASIQIAKGIMNGLADGNLEQTIQAELTASPFCTTTDEHKLAVARFSKR